MTTHLDELISLCRHPKIQERRGKWQVGDAYWDGQEIRYIKEPQGDYNPGHFISCLWIPPLSDPIRPGRSLLGMVQHDGDGYHLTCECCEIGKWSIEYDSPDGEWISAHGPTPEIAVAKAVVEQATS